jgi:addiction module RelB/DinJ family antitoxin
MKTIINIKADRDIKEKASRTAKQMGLPLSTVVNAFLRQFIDERKITFSIPLKPSKKLEKVLRATDKNIKEGKNIIGPFYSAEDMIKSLKS